MNDKSDSPSLNYKSTPPPHNRKVRNPFDKALIDRLHKPICSPGMCKIYKKRSSPFRWDIDQTCSLVPADIVACNSQFEPSPDPALERIAEEATDKFFSQEMVMPSPLESSKKVKPIHNCNSILITSFVEEEKTVVTRDVSAQTVLTLPPELPPELEKLLQPFCTFTQDQDISGEYEITANGSLRRKLFFEEHSDMEHYDSEHTDDETHEARPSSNLKPHSPLVFRPDLNEVLIASDMKHTFGTPLKTGPVKNYRNKILDNVDFGEGSPIGFRTPTRTEHGSATSSFTSTSLSPVTKVTPSDEENEVLIASDMKHTLRTPLKTGPVKSYRNKILDNVDFGEACPCSPFEFRTPTRTEQGSVTSFASASISPVSKVTPSDEEKNNFTSPESETAMAACLCIASDSVEKKDPCFCKMTPNKIILTRSKSLKESPPRSRKGSISEKRSLSMSSLHRSRSVQKLDFSMEMSVDGSLHDHSQADSEYSSVQDKEATWSIVDESSIHHLVKRESEKTDTCIQSSTKQSLTMLDETPIKGKNRDNIRSHEISKIRVTMPLSPLEMSLDNSLDDNPLSLEHKKIDFSNVDLKFLTDNVSQFDYTQAKDATTSFKRLDSGFNDNTFYANASSYYESAIKPSELTVTNISNNKNALKEISNVNWMRVDSGFKDETSTDSMQFFGNETQPKKFTGFHFSEVNNDKENAKDLERLLANPLNKDVMSMSDIFTDDMTFNCNFSSTPSKNKSRKVN